MNVVCLVRLWAVLPTSRCLGASGHRGDTVNDYKVVQFRQSVDAPAPRIEPATCTEAETFALQVTDDSMEPEFRKSCIIVVDPTGRATDGSYVLAQPPEAAPEHTSDKDSPETIVQTLLFRQLRRNADGGWSLWALNSDYPVQTTPSDLGEIIGVIVQRAGTRRSYHKRYD